MWQEFWADMVSPPTIAFAVLNGLGLAVLLWSGRRAQARRAAALGQASASGHASARTRRGGGR